MKSKFWIKFVLMCLLGFIVGATSPAIVHAARRLTPQQEAIYKARVAKKRKTGDYERRRAAAEEQVRLNDLKESSAYQRRLYQANKRKQELMAQARKAERAKSNDIKLFKGGKHNESIIFFYSKLEAKKAEAKKVLADMKILQRTLNQLVREKIQAEPDVDLSKLLSISDPNYIDDPNTITIEIVKETRPKRVESKVRTMLNETKTPVKAPVKKETGTETLFIDLKAR
jgi:hypothetical protein